MLPDLLLMMSLGFLGSFGHCATMCGPVAVAFSLSGELPAPVKPLSDAAERSAEAEPLGTSSAGVKGDAGAGGIAVQGAGGLSGSPWYFHGLLNLGRLLSYGLVGAAIGGVGEVLLAGGQLAGLGSELRRWMTLGTGGMLLWLGLVQVSPGLLPGLPIAQFAQQQHERLSKLMVQLSLKEQSWTPLLLGLCWGMIPCGFLYTAQIRAAETGRWWQGALLMLAFGLGTTPVMSVVGWVASRWAGPGQQGLASGRRSQLYRLGGWVTLAVGLLLLLRNGDSHGGGAIAYGALVLLVLALIARPLAQLGHRLTGSLKSLPWQQPLMYRRGLGVGAFVLVLVHVVHVYTVNWGWNLQVLDFLVPRHRQSVALGAGAFALMLPAALTSFDRYQKTWGKLWRRIHLLTLPALILAVAHTLLIATAYRLPGTTQGSWWATGGLGGVVLVVLLLRGVYSGRS